MKAADSLGLMKKLVVESFVQNPYSDAARKLLRYENFTHNNSKQLIDKAFLEGLKLAQKEIRELYARPSTVTVDSTKSWGKLKNQAVYTEEGVNTMRTSNREAPHKHFGNPFSSGGYAGTIKTNSVEESVEAYKNWLLGNDVGQEASRFRAQRTWILEQINEGKLDNATLLYDASLAGRGRGSHAEALAEVVREIRGGEQTPSNTKSRYNTSDKELKPGSVIKYKDKLWLVRKHYR